MLTKRNPVAAAAFVFLVLTGYACNLFDDGSGACVSDPVEFSFGLRVYCYNDWDQDECSSNDRREVNGARWTFYKGQSCEDRDLEEGSNPWP
jgi:hypothetical protein